MNELTIKELCLKFSIGQSELSRRFGIPLRTVQHWYSGERKPPDYVVRMIRDLLEGAVKHGKWIYNDGDNTCSVCRKEVTEHDDYGRKQWFNYCPHCGAKMDEEK